MATSAEQWWRASPIEWLKAAGLILGGVATAFLIVNLVVFLTGLL